MPTLPPAPDEALLTVSQVLAILHVSRSTLYALRRARLLPSVQIRGSVRFRMQDVHAYIDRHTSPGKSLPKALVGGRRESQRAGPSHGAT